MMHADTKITLEILEHAIDELSDKTMNYQTAFMFAETKYWTAQQVLVITLHWMI